MALAATITNAGLNLFGKIVAGTDGPLVSYVAVGSGTATPTTSDTQLETELFRKLVTSFVTGGNAGEMLINLSLSAGDAVGDNIEEIGFFGGAAASATANSGTLFARVLYSHTKPNTETIQIQLDLTPTA